MTGNGKTLNETVDNTVILEDNIYRNHNRYIVETYDVFDNTMRYRILDVDLDIFIAKVILDVMYAIAMTSIQGVCFSFERLEDHHTIVHIKLSYS